MIDYPIVSVVTPVYNGADFLQECIESVLNQTFPHFEYIIVNNCSTDRTLDIAMAYAAKDNRIRVHNNERFVGVIDNHNIAFSLISPDAHYCKVVSADDYIFPDYLAKTIELGEAQPSVGIIGSYQLTGDVIRWQGFQYPRSVMSGYEVGRRFFTQQQIFLHSQGIFGFGTPTSLLYRASIVRNSKAFYPNSSPHADTSACYEQLQTCDFGFVFQVLSFERIHTQTQSSTSKDLNRYFSATLNDLQQYGSFYLGKGELEHQIKALLHDYYRFLAINSVVGLRDEKFWDYHKGRLKELGHPLKPFGLFKAAISAVLHGSANPGQMLATLRGRLSRKSIAGTVTAAQTVSTGDVSTASRKSPVELGRAHGAGHRAVSDSQPVRKML